jgi:transketolase
VKIGGGHSGKTVGPDGATHQSLEELSLLRHFLNMTIIVPCDYYEAKKATIAIGEAFGPAYLRFGRSAVPCLRKKLENFRLARLKHCLTEAI